MKKFFLGRKFNVRCVIPVDEVGTDEVGTDEVGTDEVGTRVCNEISRKNILKIYEHFFLQNNLTFK